MRFHCLIPPFSHAPVDQRGGGSAAGSDRPLEIESKSLERSEKMTRLA
jgi:hypothetical protein